MTVKLKICRALTIVLLTLAARELSAQGQTYYVAINGRDSNPGTVTHPFRTIKKGVGALKPGDTLYVKSGTYAEALINNVPGGTSWDNPVTVAVLPGHSVTLRAPAGSSEVLSVAGATQRYIVVDGFVIDGANAQNQVVKISQDHIRIQNTEIIRLAQSGIGIWVVAGDFDSTAGCCNEFINLTVRDDRANPGAKDTVGLLIGSAANLIERSQIHSHWGDGILLWNDDFESANDNIVRNNTLFSNGRAGTGFAVAVGRGSGNLIYNNVIFGNSGGVSVGGRSQNAKIYNNTVYGNKSGVVIDSGDGGSSGTEVKNNIVYKNGRNILDSGTNTVLSTNFERDPLFVNAAKRDFRLQAMSAAIDAGEAIAEIQDDRDGMPRPQGLSHDVGAYEFVALPTSVTQATATDGNVTSTARARTGFDFSLTNEGNKSITRGQSASNDVSAVLSSGSAQAVSFSTTGLPAGATASYSTSTSCSPTCSRTLNIATTASTPAGTHNITVTGTGGGVSKTTSFNLAVNAANVSTDGVIALAWADNSDNESGFTIERKTGTNGTFAQIGKVGANIRSYSDTGLTAGTTYCYRLNAFNEAGMSSYTNEACKAASSATPTFDFSVANGGSRSVTRGQTVSNDITATLSSGSTQAVSFTTSGLPEGATASYSTSTSCSPTCSRTLNIATAASTPTGTHSITVTGTGGGVSKTTSFNLTVNALAPAFDFSVANGGSRSVTRGQTVSNDITATLSSGSTQAVSFTTSGLPEGATASYSTSTSCSPTCSRTLNIATAASTPTGTHSITVTGTGGGVSKTTSFDLTVNPSAAGVLDLTWMDNSSNESGFAIERKTGTNGTFAQISTVGANVRSYVDNGLTVGSTYCYRVSAFNSSGASGYSNEGCGVARLP